MGAGSRSLRSLVRDGKKIGTIAGKGEGPSAVQRARQNASRQLVEPFAEAVQAEREADTLFRGLEDDEGRGFGVAKLAQKLFVHHHFGHAAIGQATDKTGAADILIVEF